MERTKKNEVLYYIELVNNYVSDSNKITLSRRYEYYAIDFKNGNTLKTGLTLKECYNVVYSMFTLLYNEKYVNNCKKEESGAE